MSANNYKFNHITLSDGSTKLVDLVLGIDKYDERCRDFLDNLADVNATIPLDSPFWPGCTVLHLAIFMTVNAKISKESFEQLNTQQEVDLLLKTYNIPEENPLLKRTLRCRIIYCLEKGCSISITNADGLTPIHLAFKLLKQEIVGLLLKKCENDSNYSNQLSFFHIACAIGNEFIVRQLLTAGADINSQTTVGFKWLRNYSDYRGTQSKMIIVPMNSTALHIVSTFNHDHIIEDLLDMGADIYAENALRLTPIHSSMISHDFEFESYRKSSMQLLLKRAPKLKDSLNNFGLSYLHIAAYADDANTIEKLLQMGANIDSVFKVTVPELSHLSRYGNRTPLHIAILEHSDRAILTLIKFGADIFQQTPEISTPLQKIVNHQGYKKSEVMQYIEDKLKHDQRFKEPIDSNGMTLLHVACRNYDFEWAKMLLEKGADVNAQVLDDAEESDDDLLQMYGTKGATALHYLIIAIINRRMDEDEQLRNRFLKLLLDYGANLLIMNNRRESPLLLAHNCFNYLSVLVSVADLCLKSQQSYKINPADHNGFSHFHYACKRNQVDIVRKYLDNGIDINLVAVINCSYSDGKEISNFTPLHFAVYYRSVEVAFFLIGQGADVNAKSGDGQTPLHIAVKIGFIHFQLFEMLLSNGADINAEDHDHWIPSNVLLESPTLTVEQLQFFRAHGASIEIMNNEYGGSIGRAIENAKECERESILEELIVFCDVKNAMKNGYNPITDVVSVYHTGDEITIEFYLKVFQRFLDLGCNIDQQNRDGRTALHEAIKYQNLDAVEALLLFGANVNIVDENRKSPICSSNVYDKFILMNEKLANHIWKMNFVGLEIVECCDGDNVELKIYKESLMVKDSTEPRCKNELANLSQEIIGNSLSIRSFLYEQCAVVDYPTMSIIQRENVDRFFANPDTLQQQFPELSGLLLMQYRKAVARKDMYKDAMSLFPLVLRTHLPYLCLENIFKYFDNDELEYFIEEHADIISNDSS